MSRQMTFGASAEEEEKKIQMDDDGFEFQYLSQFEGKTFEGRPEVLDAGPDQNGKLKTMLVLTDKDEEKRLKINLNLGIPKVDDNDDDYIVANNKGGLYHFLDSLYHVVNKTPLNKAGQYKMYLDDFEDFQGDINENIESMKIKVRINEGFEQEDKDGEKTKTPDWKSAVVKSVTFYEDE